MGTRAARIATSLMTGAAAVGVLAGCSATGGPAPVPAPTHAAASATPLSKDAKAAIDAARAQADAAANPSVRPSAVATDTIQTWAALDGGARAYATGPATQVSPGVYRYTVQADDVQSVIALRFGLCNVDIATAASSTGVIHPGDVITVERRMTSGDMSEHDEYEEHEGWRCNYAG